MATSSTAAPTGPSTPSDSLPKHRLVVVTDALGADAIAIRPMVILGLSWDHRSLDGALAARFLASIKRRVESYEP